MKKIYLLIIFCLFSSAMLRAQTDTLTGYPIVTTGWTIGGSATAVDSTIRLTTNSTDQSGYVYYDSALDLTTCGQFTVDFEFKITVSSSSTPADGIAFWYISNPPTSFTSGGGCGLPNYADGLILINDTYDNDGNGNNPLETLLGYDGTVMSYTEGSPTGQLGSVVGSQTFIDDGSWHHCKIDYNSGVIKVYYNYSATPSITASHPLTIVGYFGFSASTGAAYSVQSIKNVHIVALDVTSVPPVISPVTYCVGDTASALTATSTGGVLHWYTTDTATVVSLPGAPTPSTATPGTHTYYVRQGAGTCLSNPDSIQVIVSEMPPAPNITGDTFYCSGATYVPFSSTDTGLVWYTVPTGGTGSTTVPTVPTSTAGSYTYYASQSIYGCQGPRDSIHVTVNATPDTPVMTAGQLIYCQYAPFVPFAVTGSNQLWYTTPPPGTGSATAPTINTADIGAADFYVTQTVATCTSAPLHLHVAVNPKPVAPVAASPTYCQFASATPLSATGSGLTWYGPGVTAGYGTAPTPSTTTPAIDVYYVTQTVLGCASDSGLTIVTINPKPLPPVTRDTAYCQYSSSAALTATGTNITWYTTSTGSSGLLTAPVPPTSTAGSTTWYATQTMGGCESDRSSLSVGIIAAPVFSIAPSALSVCQYDSLTLSYSGTPYIYSYLWTLPSGAYFAAGTTATDVAAVVRFDVAAKHNYVLLTATNPDGHCSATDTIDIKSVAQPGAAPFTNEQACLGDTLHLALTNQTDDASSFTWTVDNDSLNNSPAVNIISANHNSGGPFVISWTQAGPHIITLYSFTAEGCKSNPAYDTIRVNAYPDANFTFKAPQGHLCIEDSVLFMAVDTSYYDLYQWAPEHYFNNDNGHTIWGKVEEAKSIITLTVTDPNGCRSSTTQELDPGYCCTISMPSAFTPNDDHVNDLFRPIASGYHRFHSMRIVNRWGQQVFESTNNVMEWDGTYAGTPQDMGVYYYVITYDCGGETMVQKGDVTLIR